MFENLRETDKTEEMDPAPVITFYRLNNYDNFIFSKNFSRFCELHYIPIKRKP